MLISNLDHSRLVPLVADALSNHESPVFEALDDMLANATILPSCKVPADLVTMNSEVVVEIPAGSAPRQLRLVYSAPKSTAETKTVSVFSPMGVALLGARVGSTVALQLGAQTRSLRIAAMPYQPERSGDLDL
jgi:regulator of nucleoside diphosphate kinase